MSKDIKFFSACNHYVNNQQYREDMCPRCYGKGYYVDIAFDNAGKAVLADKTIKLQQECLKVLLDDKMSDLFFPHWGSEVNAFIGKKKTAATKARLEMTIRSAIERLKEIQEHEALSNAHINAHEIINKIEYIELEPVSATDWRCLIVLSTVAGDTISQEFAI